MAKIALFSPSVLSSAAAGRRLPTLQVTLGFAAACGADRTEWWRRWQAVAGQAAAHRPVGQRRPGSGTGSGRAGHGTGRGAGQPPSRQPRPAQLPVAPQVVGREETAAAARALVAGAARRPLVVSGPVGVGKSAFAMRLAAELAAEWPDGQLYADLGGHWPHVTSPYDVVAGFLGALGVRSAPAEPWQRVALYRSLLADRRVLVLLDEAVDEQQVRPLLAQSPRSQVVVTSRSRLLGLESADRLWLDVLTRAESAAMLGAALATVRVPADAGTLDQLAELCSDLPLALDIVARMLVARPGWPVAYTVTRLVGGGESGLLGRLRVGDAGVRGRLASAFARQPPTTRAVFCRLGSLRTTLVTAAGVAAALGLSPESAEDHLEALLDAGLLRRAAVAGHYQVPRLFGLFASEQATTVNTPTERAGGLGAAEPSGRRRCVGHWVRRCRSVRV